MTDTFDFDRSKLQKNINVNLAGKDYIEFKKYEDKKVKKNYKSFNKIVYHWRYFIAALFVYAMGKGLLYTIFPTVYKQINYGSFEVFGLVFPYMLLYIMIVIIGISWIIHGIGFVIIKR